MSSIFSYPWPGNLRELRNAVERAVILGREPQIVPADLPAELRQPAGLSADGVPEGQSGGAMTLEQLEEQHIRRMLAQTRTVAEAAQILGIDQATVYRKMKKLGLGNR